MKNPIVQPETPPRQTGRVRLTPGQLKVRKIHQYLMDETTITEALQIVLIMMHLAEFLDAPGAECQ